MAFVTVWFKTITEPHPQKRQEIPFTYLNCTDNYDVIEIINIYLQIAKLFFCGGSLDYILFNLLTSNFFGAFYKYIVNQETEKQQGSHIRQSNLS